MQPFKQTFLYNSHGLHVDKNFVEFRIFKENYLNMNCQNQDAVFGKASDSGVFVFFFFLPLLLLFFLLLLLLLLLLQKFNIYFSSIARIKLGSGEKQWTFMDYQDSILLSESIVLSSV
jgi:hypothetical protein